MKKNLTILEDQDDCCFVYSEILGSHYNLSFCANLKALQENLNQSMSIDLLIADLCLPDGFFLDFIAAPSCKLNSPFLVISSLDDISVFKLSFEEGAIDYLCKPFNKNELLIKIQRALDASNKPQTESFDIDNPEFNDLTLKERQILNAFMKSKNSKVSREELNQRLWPNINVHPKTLDVHLYNLRRKLKLRGITISFDGDNSWKLEC